MTSDPNNVGHQVPGALEDVGVKPLEQVPHLAAGLIDGHDIGPVNVASAIALTSQEVSW
jgi:hypothetical protein